jgi:peptidoglycan/xylan/chitin deacetylase (PgdA/CDA1 family)
MMSRPGAVAMSLASRVRAGGIIVNEHTLDVAQTRRHVETLGRWFDLISHEDLLDRLERPRSRPFCLLTFDDGKRSNATETAPELVRLGVPAVFYLPSQFVGGGEPLWFDRYEVLMRALGAAPPGLEPDTVKELPFTMLEARIDRACRRYGIDPNRDDDTVRPMSWAEVRELGRRGFTIGAHSRRHAILTREPLDAALADIEQSLAEVSAQLGAPCRTFAFPNGNYTARLARHALSCGVESVMTTEPIWATPGMPRWRLPRIQLFGEMRPARMELKIALAAATGALANPDGTGRLYRRIGGLSRRKTGAVPGFPSRRPDEGLP